MTPLRWTGFYAGLFLLCGALLIVTMDRAINPYDEALILTGALRMQEGAFPYRDFYANYGPAQFAVLAGLFKLFGASVLVERLWDVAVRAGIAVLSFALIDRAGSRAAAWGGALVVTLWLSFFRAYAYPVFPCLLLSLAAALLLLRARPAFWIASGACLGLAAAFRPEAGMLSALALSAFCLTQPGGRWRRLAWLWCGFLTVCALLLLCIAAAGAVHDFIFDLIWFPAHFYARMRSLPPPGLPALLQRPAEAIVYIPPLVWLAVIIFGRSAPLPVLLCCLSAAFTVKGIVRVSPVHMAMGIVPALIAGAIVAAWGRTRSGRILPAGVAALAVILTGWALLDDIDVARANVRWASSAVRGSGFDIDPVDAAAARYILENTKPSDALFVGSIRHDRIFANDMLLYVLTGRRPATRWYHYDPGLQTSAAIQRQMIADLERMRPTLIVLDPKFSGFEENNGSRESSHVHLLDDFLKKTYAPVVHIGRLTVMSPTIGR